MTQRGAIFGLDVRLAIVLGGLMAAALSTEMLTDFEGDRQVKTERKLEAVRDALLLRYGNSASTTFTSTLSSLYTDGYMESTGAYYLGDAAEQAAVDGWGQNIVVATTSASKTILGATSITTHFGVLISGGPDKTVQSTTTLANESAYQSWVIALGSDDIAIKFNTVLIERDRVLKMQSQLSRIMEALNTYAQRRETAHIADCTTANCGCDDAVPVTCTSLSKSYCDRTSDNYYCPGEEKMYNFYPTNTTESVSNPTLAYTVVMGGATYTSANLTSMRNLMTLIGLPTAFAQDPWDRTLNYSSNEYATTAAPYTASVWYQ